MKKLMVFTLMFLMTVLVAGCSANTVPAQSESGKVEVSAEEKLGKSQTPTTKRKALVVYFSHSGNTRVVAQQVQKSLNADILELKTVVPYTTVYNDLTKQARQELDTGYRPQLQPYNVDVKNYDTIVIASPIWWGTVALPIFSFLDANNLAGKIVLPIVTHGGSGIARSVINIRELCPDATVKDGLAIRGSAASRSQGDIDEWLGRVLQ